MGDGGGPRRAPGRFTNEVQHQSKMLAWEKHLRRWKGLPVYVPRAGPALQQVWIARHRRWLGRKRNGSRTLGYQPSYANQQAHARRWRGWLERDGPLREQVLAGLGAGWSPAQVAGRLALDEGRHIISPESISRFIYAQMARKKDYSWRHYLPRAKAKRGFRGRRGGSPATHIAHRVPLSQRHHAAADRATFGHWEGDLMHFGNHGPALLALAERHSRLVLLARLPGKGADVTADTIARLLAPLPPAWRQTITFDNGTEFARHYRLHPLGIQTFFCDTRSPWQKGGVENAIGRLRRPLPRSSKLGSLSEAAFTAALQLYNNTPRKCRGYRTPAETLDDQVLHLEWNSPSCLRRNDARGGVREGRWGCGGRRALLVAEGVPLRRDGRFANRPYNGELGMRRGFGWGCATPRPSGYRLSPVRRWGGAGRRGGGLVVGGALRVPSATVMDGKGVWVPGGLVADDGVEDGEELVHAGDECHLLGFALGHQPVVEGPDDRIGAQGR